MKKFLVFVSLFLASSVIKADDIVRAALIDHVMTVTQFKSGETA